MTRYFDPHRKTMQEDPKETGTPVSPVPLPLVDAPAVEPDGTGAELENPQTPPEEVVDSSNWVPVAELANPQRESRSPSEMWPNAAGSSVSSEVRTSQSWLFRLIEGMGRWTEFFFGVASLIGCLAFATGLPGLQILTLGYLIECSGRVGRSHQIRSGLPGLRRAARLGSIVIGTLMTLFPLFYVSSLLEAARLIEPTSRSVVVLQSLQTVLMFLILPHLIASWFCGGKLRYFVWPLLAPYQLSVWMLRWVIATAPLREILDQTLGRLWPNLVADLCHVRPLTDFFLPAILLKHLWRRTLYSHARDGFWKFVGGLHLLHLTRLGLQTLAGSVAWLFVPTFLLIGGTQLPSGPAILSGLLGILSLSVVSIYLPLLQVHYGTVGKMHALFDLPEVFKVIRKSPLRTTLACTLFLAAALPLYALKIEEIDPSLVWLPGLVFILFSLPARLLVAWSYARAVTRESQTLWFWRWPVRSLIWPPVLFFSIFVSVTRFTSWGGAFGLFEHHAFLIPAPFMQWF